MLRSPLQFFFRPRTRRVVLPSLDDVPELMREEVLRFRETSAGRYALRMFAEHRKR